MLRISGTYPVKTLPAPEFALRVLSLGAGVQSSRLLLGILEGEYGEIGVDAPSVAIFSDTGWEPKPVYDHLEWLIQKTEGTGFEIHIVSAGNIRNNVVSTTRGGKKEGRFVAIPLHTKNLDGENMKMKRQCTREYKIAPIEKKTRELLGLKPRQHCKVFVESWQGISYDETQRMRVNEKPWIWNRYPLIEARETRADCLKWAAERGYREFPKSSCVACPFHDNRYWLWLKTVAPDDFEDAVAFDNMLEGGALGFDRPVFVHRSHRRLRDVIPELEILADMEASQGNLFDGMDDECFGGCGT